MTETITRSNLKVVGTTNSAGGFFREVKITGEGYFSGDVDCEKLNVTGNIEVEGSLQVTKMKLTGGLTLKDHLKGNSLRGQGEVKAASLKVDDVHINGSLEINGDCEGEHLRISGSCNVTGLLSAEKLEINLYGPSKAKEVGGSSLTIKKSKTGRLMELVKPTTKLQFEAGVIECDTVELVNTKASVVRGKRVIVGADCEIETVEYRESLEIHKHATVKYQVKI